MGILKILSQSFIPQISNSRVQIIIKSEQPKPQSTKTISSQMSEINPQQQQQQQPQPQTTMIQTVAPNQPTPSTGTSSALPISPAIAKQRLLQTGDLDSIEWIHERA